MDLGSLKLPIQGLFVVALTVLILNWLGSKLLRFFSKWKKSAPENEALIYTQETSRYSQDKKAVFEKLQNEQDEKTKDYTERIIKPKEEEKHRKKLEEYARLTGQSWKGAGHALGGHETENIEDGDHLSPNQNAARRRTVQENINQRVAAEAVVSSKKQRPKKVIELPEEPSTSDSNAVTIIFRTPIGTTCQRRFSAEHFVKNVLDFITTQGFSQRIYTIATSYPRQLLDDPSVQIASLNLSRRVVLNIEEKE